MFKGVAFAGAQRVTHVDLKLPQISVSTLEHTVIYGSWQHIGGSLASCKKYESVSYLMLPFSNQSISSPTTYQCQPEGTAAMQINYIKIKIMCFDNKMYNLLHVDM